MPTLGLNAALTIGANLLGVRLDPYMSFNFLVEIEGLIVGGFSEVTGLQVEVEVTDHREGGENNFIHKLPGPARYPQNLVLKHGLTDVPSLWLWQQDVIKGKFKRKNGTIYLLSRLGIPAMWWDFQKAYPVKWVGPELRAANAVVAVESIDLVHEGISRPTLDSLVAGAIGAAASASVSLL